MRARLADEFAEAAIASNSLWPRTLVATAAVQNLLGGDEAMAEARKPEIYADSAYAVLNRDSRQCTGNSFLCEDVLREEGVDRSLGLRLRRRRGPAGRPVRRPRLGPDSDAMDRLAALAAALTGCGGRIHRPAR